MLLLDVGIVQGFGKVRKQRDGKLLVKGSSKSLNLTSSQNEVRVDVPGASGYSGSEVLQLLANHPQFGIALMTADRKSWAANLFCIPTFEHLGLGDLPDLIAIKDANFSDLDVVFCCLPHGTTQLRLFLRFSSCFQEIIKGLPKHLRIVDLSALPVSRKKLYMYGLTEVLREEIKNSHLVANPGCYPTSVELPLVPLIKVSMFTLHYTVCRISEFSF
ncbi:putative N-acetyl-gamma-glutamyl-phosphate reductase, chloroplastic [Glycine soja]